MKETNVLEFLKSFNLKLFTPDIDIEKSKIIYARINRPALQLAGFFDYFDSERIQIIGMVEHTFLSKMLSSERKNIFKKLFERPIPCIVFCRGLYPFEEVIELAKEHNIPILGSDEITTDFIGESLRWLKFTLAPTIVMHGVLVDVYGEGMMIVGESGIGKSEMALELIKRGHRLVAYDAVEIKKVSNQTLLGSCPEVIRFFIELRGIGIIDVSKMFGIQSIKETHTIDLIIKLEMWDKSKEYDRLGLHDEYMEILGNSVVSQTIPIRPGRNLAMIGESAAVNHRQKKMGYSSAAESLNQRIKNNMELK